MNKDEEKPEYPSLKAGNNGHDPMAGHDHKQMSGMDHSMHMGNFKQKFWFSLVLAVPIIFLSPMMGVDLPFQFTFPGSDWWY